LVPRNETRAKRSLTLPHVRKHSLDIEIELGRELLPDAMHLGNDWILPHDQAPINSSGVRMRGIW
jgi:hypothetical protein